MLGVCLNCNRRAELKMSRNGGYLVSCACGKKTLWFPNEQLAVKAWNKMNTVTLDKLGFRK